jgi:hypothetical protein
MLTRNLTSCLLPLHNLNHHAIHSMPYCLFYNSPPFVSIIQQNILHTYLPSFHPTHVLLHPFIILPLTFWLFACSGKLSYHGVSFCHHPAYKYLILLYAPFFILSFCHTSTLPSLIQPLIYSHLHILCHNNTHIIYIILYTGTHLFICLKAHPFLHSLALPSLLILTQSSSIFGTPFPVYFDTSCSPNFDSSLLC